MSNKHRSVLFYVNMSLITLVNLILIYAMFSYFVLHQPPLQIKWLLGVFTTEILGCFVLGWRKLFNAENKPITPENKTSNPNLIVAGNRAEAIVIEKAKIREDANNPDVILKGKGVELLVRARNNNYSLDFRKKYAQKSIRIFAQISKNSPAYIAAQYNTATAYRILANFTKAISLYEKVRELVTEKGAHYTENEHREWAAAIERMIGNVYYEQNLLLEARSFYLKSWKLSPDDLIGMLNLFELAVRLNKEEEARMWAEMLSTHKDYHSVSSLIDTKLRLFQNGSTQSAA